MWGCYATAPDDGTPVENLTNEFLTDVCRNLTFQTLTLSNKQYSTWRRPLEPQYQSQETHPILNIYSNISHNFMNILGIKFSFTKITTARIAFIHFYRANYSLYIVFTTGFFRSQNSSNLKKKKSK